MKKLLIAALLILALVFTVAACTGDTTPDETTAGDATTVETPTTEAPTAEATEELTAEVTEDASADVTTEEPVADTTEEPVADTTEEPAPDTTEEPAPDTTKEPETTEEPTADPADPVLLLNPEDLEVLASAGAPNVNQIGTPEVKTEGKKTFLRLTAAGGDPYVAIVPINSNCDLPNYMAISYRTNSAVEGQFFVGSGAGWTGNGDSFMVTWTEGDWSFMIVDLSQTGVSSITGALTYLRMDFFAGDSAEGDYFDVQYIGFFNSAAYAEAYDFEINPPYVDPTEADMKGLSFDTFYLNSQMYFPEDGGAGDKLTAINNTLTFASASELQNIALRGWIGFGQPIDQFGYYVDNYEFIFGDFKQDTGADVLGAGGPNASRFQINVDLSYLEGDDHFVGFVVKLEDGTIVKLRADITIDLPELPKDVTVPQNTNLFQSNVASNDPNTRFDASDLNSNGMTCFLPIPDGCVVQDTDGDGVSDAYYLRDINEVFGDVNGAYSFSANILYTASSGSSMMIVRGYRAVNSADYPGPYHINNYYEDDGVGFFAGSGLGVTIANGNLYVCVKAYNPDTEKHVKNEIVSMVAAGSTVTIADNGETVYVLLDGVLCATVEFSGETTYEKLTAAGSFAQTVTVTMADGTTKTVENTLVATTYTQ
ncbi:MAG: hypothetical protein IKU90_04460, partial [Clostridia bacterium]|nr:hypothetical protein [Clostridia bacterium]